MSPPRKRCIVIGGSGALGRVVVRELANQGAVVGFTYFKGRSVAETLERELPGVAGRHLDLAEPEALAPGLEELCQTLGGVDALVYAAVASSTFDPPRFDELAEVTPRGFQRMLDVNVSGALFACQYLAPRFEAGGNIVLVGSIDGTKPIPSTPPYAISKAALTGIVLSLSKALGPRSIRVNQVAPGILENGASRTLPGNLRHEYLRHCGLRRFGHHDEIASVVAWLALENTYVTGQTLTLDGGL